MVDRIYYSGPLHGEEELEAVATVLRGGPNALKIGRNVAERTLEVSSQGRKNNRMIAENMAITPCSLAGMIQIS